MMRILSSLVRYKGMVLRGVACVDEEKYPRQTVRHVVFFSVLVTAAARR